MQVDLRRRGLQSFNPAEFANSEEHLALLLQVRQLDLSFNSLYSIRGLEGLTHLTVLNISHNGLRSLGGGLPLTLTELDASHNCLGTLHSAALLPLQFLVSLNVAFNELEDLRGVPNVTAQLSYLDVRSNRLRALNGIEHCAQLHTLHAEANLLREVADVASLKCLPNLTAVFLSGNPILLRKRLLHHVRLLLPPSVDHDDLPTTAPASSVRSSTAAPPSVPDTSSVVCSLESSVSVPPIDYRGSDATQLSQHSSRPASACQSDLPLAIRFAAGPSTAAQPLAPRPTSGMRTLTSPASYASPFLSADPAASTLPTTAISPGVVGGDTDSPTCPRRALPHEHRLGDSPASAKSASSETPGSRVGPARPTGAAATAAASVARRAQPPVPASAVRGAAVSPATLSSLVRSSERARSELPRAALEEQLVRVMGERDASRREVLALRQEVADLRQRLASIEEGGHNAAETVQDEAPASTWMPSALEDPVSATLSSIPPPTPSRIVLSANGSVLKETGTPAVQQRPSSRVLAVEMSENSSVATSDGGKKKEVATAATSQRSATVDGDRSSRTQLGTPSPTETPSGYPEQRTTLASAGDRRAIAALFMAKLKKSSAT